MLAFTFVVTLVGLVSLGTAGYVLEDNYSPDQFFSMFDFFTDPDPTNGFVQYVDQNTAQSSGYINTENGQIYMGVDHTNVASSSGRQSVRLTSKKSYTHGLIILDASHMPGGICGTWPAFWTVGPNWPAAGEIDIIEGVNSQDTNAMTLHTGSGCSITNNGTFSGSIITPNCDTNAAGQSTNAGCQIGTSNDASYGTGFNNGQGGVYATEWTSNAISIWFFPRSAIPSDVSSGNPDPSGWGQPMASFSGGCDIDSFFNNNQIVFDTTFCGSWAGTVWSSDPVCGSKAATCQSFVQNNPSAFQDAYWSVNSLQVFQSSGDESSNGANSSIVATASVSISSATGAPSSIPPIVLLDTPTTSGVVQTTGFSQGGNGRHTRLFGSPGNFPTRAAFASASASLPSRASFKERSATATEGMPVTVAVAADGSIGEVNENAASPAVPTPTPTPTPPAFDDADKDSEVTYRTVSALGFEDFHDKERKRSSNALPVSEPELTIEPRSAFDSGIEGRETAKIHLSQYKHRHFHRHLLRPGVAAAFESVE